MPRRRSKRIFIFFSIILIVCYTVGFYFWEVYLFSHYLGGYNQYGLPVQSSHSGYWFFLSAWPVWTFPLFCLLAIIFFVYFIRSSKSARGYLKLLDRNQKNEDKINQLLLEAEDLKHKLSRARKKTHLQKKYHQLEQEFSALRNEYEQSLDFIEKLLDKLQKEDEFKE